MHTNTVYIIWKKFVYTIAAIRLPSTCTKKVNNLLLSDMIILHFKIFSTMSFTAVILCVILFEKEKKRSAVLKATTQNIQNLI